MLKIQDKMRKGKMWEERYEKKNEERGERIKQEKKGRKTRQGNGRQGKKRNRGKEQKKGGGGREGEREGGREGGQKYLTFQQSQSELLQHSQPAVLDKADQKGNEKIRREEIEEMLYCSDM